MAGETSLAAGDDDDDDDMRGDGALLAGLVRDSPIFCRVSMANSSLSVRISDMADKGGGGEGYYQGQLEVINDETQHSPTSF